MSAHLRRFAVAALALTAVAAGACSPSGDDPDPGPVVGKLQATAVLLDERVRNSATGGRIGVVDDIDGHLVHLMERNVVPATFRFSYADANRDGVVDDGRIELDDGEGNKVCVSFGADTSTPGEFHAAPCADPELPLSGPSTLPAPPASTGAQPSAPTTVDRPKLPGGAGRAAATADQLVADDLARRLGVEAVAVAAFDGSRPESVAVLDEVRTESLPPGAQMVFTDADRDGYADGAQVSVVAVNGVGACLRFTPDPTIASDVC